MHQIRISTLLSSNFVNNLWEGFFTTEKKCSSYWVKPIQQQPLNVTDILVLKWIHSFCLDDFRLEKSREYPNSLQINLIKKEVAFTDMALMLTFLFLLEALKYKYFY